MDGNPYARLIALTREQGADAAPAPVKPGQDMTLETVVTAAPLTVQVAGIVQPSSALRLNERLAAGAKWKTKTVSPDSDYNALAGPISGPVSTPAGQGSLVSLTAGQVHSGGTTIDKAVVEQLEIDLEPGDTVLLLTQDDQVFYIVMKVVKAV